MSERHTAFKPCRLLEGTAAQQRLDPLTIGNAQRQPALQYQAGMRVCKVMASAEEVGLRVVENCYDVADCVCVGLDSLLLV
jgi:hypothetical protein